MSLFNSQVDSIQDNIYTSVILQHFIRDVQLQNPIGWKGREPFVQKGIEQGRVVGAGDVDPIARGEAAGYRTLIRAQADDELGSRQRLTQEMVEAQAEIKLRVREQAAAVKEAGEAMKIEIESAVDQSYLRREAQSLFLFGAQEQIIDLICQRITRIAFEERLKWTLGMLLVGCLKWVGLGKRADERRLSDTACTNNRNQFTHIHSP